MFVTHSYLGTTIGPYRCLFFLLLEDYLEAQSAFADHLSQDLERFARNLGDKGALVRPFLGDVETVRVEVHDKPWSAAELEEVRKTPAILMIDRDFDQFSPREHPWFLLHFGRRAASMPDERLFRSILGELVDVVKDPSVNVFEAAAQARHEITAADVVKVFEAKPSLFGFSINLIGASSLLRKVYERMRAT